MTALQTKTDIVNEIYARFGEGDIDGLVTHLTDDIVWIDPGAEFISYSGNRYRHDGVKDFFNGLFENLRFESFGGELTIEKGDTVVVLGEFKAVGINTGKPVTTRFAHFWTFTGDKVSRYEVLFNVAAVAAAISN